MATLTADVGRDVLTCITCRQTFSTGKAQRLHYQSEFHRFNLKRKVADLPPVSEEVFNQKIQALKAEEIEVSESAYCSVCKKSFASKQTFDSHVKSKKHLDKAKKIGSGSDSLSSSTNSTSSTESTKRKEHNTQEEGVEGPEKTVEELIEEKLRNAKRLEIGECLFCQHSSKTLDKNIQHMVKEHGFFIPDVEYLQDAEGLVQYLGEKVAVGNCCLYCEKLFRSTEAVQSHMISRSHCKLKNDDDDELEDFYDFSASWAEEGTAEGEGEVESTTEAETTESGTREEPKKQLVVLSKKQFEELEAKADSAVADITDGGYTMVLSSGKSVGHRDLKMFYKQRYRPQDDRPSVKLANVLREYRSLGWHNSPAERVARKLQLQQQRQLHKDRMHLGCKANKFQTHFREQVIF